MTAPGIQGYSVPSTDLYIVEYLRGASPSEEYREFLLNNRGVFLVHPEVFLNDFNNGKISRAWRLGSPGSQNRRPVYEWPSGERSGEMYSVPSSEAGQHARRLYDKGRKMWFVIKEDAPRDQNERDWQDLRLEVKRLHELLSDSLGRYDNEWAVVALERVGRIYRAMDKAKGVAR